MSDDWLPLAKSGNIQDSFDVLFDLIETYIREEDVPSLVSLLSQIQENVKDLPTIILVSSLRLTYLARHSISNWSSVRDFISRHLSNSGENPEKILIGLYE